MDAMKHCDNVKSSCQFCLEIDKDPSSVYFTLAKDCPPDRTIFRNGSFRVIPPLGQFVEGSVMIVTEEHVPSCADLTENKLEELDRLIGITVRLLTSVYEPPVIFEHGPSASENKGTCCVDHAHIHAFPVDVDVRSALRSDFREIEICDLKEIRGIQRASGGYLFLQQEGLRFVYPCDFVPSQYIRQVIAEDLGVPERWHWRSYLGLEELKLTYDKLVSADWR